MATLKDLASFYKKKGFIYPSCEIYGGIAGLYDYGHVGTLLKKNLENLWREYFLGLSDNYFEIETANIMHENVFKASGHLEKFNDPIIKCSKCTFYDRADHFIAEYAKVRVEGQSVAQLSKVVQEKGLRCPNCTSAFEEVRETNMMFPLAMGQGRAFLRPETAQSPYVNFKLQYEIQRKKLPLGLALIGRAYRNEISPRNLTLRQREFTQAELQIFFDPSTVHLHPDFEAVKNYKLRVLLEEDRKKGQVVERSAAELLKKGIPQFYTYHLVKVQQFCLELMHIAPSKFRLYQLNDKEKAFYNKYHFDVEIDLQELGFSEMGGLHYRTDHDLSGHQRVSKQSMEVMDEGSGRKFIPHVLEISFGVDRSAYALLDAAYDEDKERGNVVLHLPSAVTPFVCAVFPLVKNKEEVAALAKSVYGQVRGGVSCYYDEVGSIGRRYARADEIGVRWCITIDFDSLNDGCVTVRDRETTRQERVKIIEVVGSLRTWKAGKAKGRASTAIVNED